MSEAPKRRRRWLDAYMAARSTGIACARSPLGRMPAFLRLRALTLLPLGLLLQRNALKGYIIQTEELAIRTKAHTRPSDMRHRTELLSLGYSFTVKGG